MNHGEFRYEKISKGSARIVCIWGLWAPEISLRISANVQRWLGGYSVDDEDTAQLVTTNEFAEFKELYRY